MDLQPNGTFLPGGTVLYSGVMARRLGWAVRVVTSGASFWVLARHLPDAAVVVRDSVVDTVFENQYIGGTRRQRILSRAESLALEDIPPDWLSSDVVHLAPIAQEIPIELALTLGAPLPAATPQGWMRRIDAEGRVYCTALPRDSELLARLAMVMSLDDLGGNWELVRRYGEVAKTLVITLGKDGALLFERGQKTHIQPVSAREVDPTGAGDVFAAAFFCKLAEGMPAADAALFASCAAALSVSGQGVDAVPTAQSVDALYRAVRPSAF